MKMKDESYVEINKRHKPTKKNYEYRTRNAERGKVE